MKHLGFVLVAITLGLRFASPASADETPDRIVGRFVVDDSAGVVVAIQELNSGGFDVRAWPPIWRAAWVKHGETYRGIFYDSTDVSRWGVHTGWFEGAKLHVQTWSAGSEGASVGLWTRVPLDVELPQLPGGPVRQHALVDDLPEAITKVPPVYPEAARLAGIDGVVLLDVLVGKDGRARDVRVKRGIPELDTAAIAAVEQWVFKPAVLKGRPVDVRIQIPIRFTVH